MLELTLSVGLLVLLTVVATAALLRAPTRRGPRRPPEPDAAPIPPETKETAEARPAAPLDIGPETTPPPDVAPEVARLDAAPDGPPSPAATVEEAPVPTPPAVPTVEDAPAAAPPSTLSVDEATTPAPSAPTDEDAAPAAPAGAPEAPAVPPETEVPAPTLGRLVRLRSRLSRSQSLLGRGLLSLLSRETVDDEVWEEVEATLLRADIGVAASTEIVERLRERVRVLGTRGEEELRGLLREELLAAIGAADRTLRSLPHEDRPAVMLVVGVNGTGKTTTCGKLARVLVADGRSVVLGAADTFRAAAAEQLTTWAGRVGAEVVRAPEGGDPAAVAYDAVRTGVDRRADTVVIDTAGRLHTKTGLMDELSKIKRVAERLGVIDEVLLVLDATTGQNGVVQAREFAGAVGVTGIVLTKLDGTAKGGIVVAVQRELGIPVKLVGLGEGPDDLAPFEPAAFVDALLGESPDAPSAV